MLSPQPLNQSLLMFRVGPVLCCAPSQPVVSIIVPPPMNHPPGSSDNQPGIFRYTDQVYRVVDLRYGFGISKARQKQPGRLILAQIASRNIAFWIDDIIDVLESPASGWGNLPAYIPHGIFSRTVIINEKIHLFVEFDKLLQLRGTGYLREYLEVLQQSEEKSPQPQASTTAAASKIVPETDDLHREETRPERGAPQVAAMKSKPARPTSARDNTTGKTGEIAAAKKSVTPTTPAKTSPAHTSLENHPAPAARSITTPASDRFGNPALPSTTTPRQHPSTHSRPGLAGDRSQGGSPKRISSAAPAGGRSAQQSHGQRINRAQPSSNTPSHVSLTAAHQPAVSSVAWEQRGSEPRETQPPLATAGDEATSASSWLIVLLVLFLLGFTGLAGWQLLSSGQSSMSPRPAATIPVTPRSQTSAGEKPGRQDTQRPAATAETPVHPEHAQHIEESVAIPDTARVQYQAEIQHNDREVTLILRESITPATTQQESPATQPSLNEITENPSHAAPTVAQTVTPLPATTITTEPQRRVIRRITHIVVPGDTLWAIARHYVDDPYRYPELARLSKIKNPDRIYPGNRIHIHFEQEIRRQ